MKDLEGTSRPNRPTGLGTICSALTSDCRRGTDGYPIGKKDEPGCESFYTLIELHKALGNEMITANNDLP